jgi:hypothetical protein
MTTFEYAVAIAETLLRFRGQWKGCDTHVDNIADAVIDTCLFLGPDANGLSSRVRTELIRRTQEADES